jgi:hypothetical protein
MNRRKFLTRCAQAATIYPVIEISFLTCSANAQDSGNPPQNNERNWEIESQESDILNKQLIVDNLVIQGVDITLSSENVPSGNNLVVYAETIRIKGTIQLPGRNVYLHAKNIFSDNGIIDVSGSDCDSKATITSRANDGTSPGANGTDGADGGDGNNGGIVIIGASNINGSLSIFANGGNACDGQPGGNGAKGGKGPTGSSGTSGYVDSPAGDGGKGSRGGDAGKGGKGGKGGDCGEIKIYLINSIPVDTKLITVVPQV